MGHSDKEITDRVIQARERAGLNKVEFADRIGLSKQGYTPYELGKTAFTVQQLFKIASVLGRPVEYFLGLDTGLTGREERVLILFREAEKAGYGDVVIGAVHAMVAQLLTSAGQVGEQVSDKP